MLLLFLFAKVNPWIRTDYEKVGRTRKIYATDTGLMSSILNWNLDDVMLDGEKCGKIVETFVFNELSAQLELQKGYKFYHYRDRDKREIDFLIENDRGILLGVEVKAGSVVSKSDFRHMVWFKENIANDREFISMIVYSGENVLQFGPDMYAVPIAALWD
jgi:predicted AAA+ superfamily ATPase